MPRYFSASRSDCVELLVHAVTPLTSGAHVQPFGGGFGKSIGQRLHHDGVVVVVILLVGVGEGIRAKACRDGERANVVSEPALDWRDEVSKRQVRDAVGHLLLLPQHRKPGDRGQGPCVARRQGSDASNTTMSLPSVAAGQKP